MKNTHRFACLLLLIAALVLLPPRSAADRALQDGAPVQTDEPPNLYSRVLQSAEGVENHAHAMMPGGRVWFFDREHDRQHLEQLRLAAQQLERDQAAFEASLTPEQVSKFDGHIHSLHQLRAELQFRIESLDHELRKRQPEKWHLAADTAAIPKLTKEWKKQDHKIAKATGMAR